MNIFTKITLSFIAVFVLSSTTVASTISLTEATSLRCSFQPGFDANWRNGNPQITKGKFGSDITFHSIDMKNGTAQMTGNADTVKLKVFATTLGLTFLEWIDGDVVVVTTIYQQHPRGDQSRYTAVHSRHRITVSAQYHGTCVAL